MPATKVKKNENKVLGFATNSLSATDCRSVDPETDSLVVTDWGERQCVGWVERVSCRVSLASQPFRTPYLFV